jgi:transposase-like protein
LLLERLALAAIARVTGVSERWLQLYVNQKFYETPKVIEVTKKKVGRLTIQLDEMWSFVSSKENKQWVWLAIDANSREIVGVFVGDRSRQSATKLWQSLPPVYRQCGICYTDFWEAYEQVLRP